MGSGREEGMEKKEREKKKRQRGRQGARFTDSNEIIEEAREWASEGAEQKDKKCRQEDCDFLGQTLVCGCNTARQHYMCILQQCEYFHCNPFVILSSPVADMPQNNSQNLHIPAVHEPDRARPGGMCSVHVKRSLPWDQPSSVILVEKVKCVPIASHSQKKHHKCKK